MFTEMWRVLVEDNGRTHIVPNAENNPGKGLLIPSKGWTQVGHLMVSLDPRHALNVKSEPEPEAEVEDPGFVLGLSTGLATLQELARESKDERIRRRAGEALVDAYLIWKKGSE